MKRTAVAGGYDAAAWEKDAFDMRRLEVAVEDSNGGSPRWLMAEVIFDDVILFWRNFLSEYGPYKDKLPPCTSLTEFK